MPVNSREQLRQQIDSLPDKIIEQIAQFTQTLTTKQETLECGDCESVQLKEPSLPLKGNDEIDSNEYDPIRPEDLPYLKCENLEGRPILLDLFHDGKKWHYWVPLDNGLLQPIAVYDCLEMIYLAKQPVRDSDASFPLINFLYKHVDIKNIDPFLSALISDIFNLGTSLKKLDLILEFKGLEIAPRLVTTELEYLILLCRSMFDLLQEIVSRTWDTVELIDKSIKKKKLPSSFRDMVLYEKKIQSSEQIRERFGVNPSLAEWYSKYAPFFCNLREVRDAIVHQTLIEPLIYIDDKGFSIGIKSSPSPFQKLVQFPENILEKESIAPLNYFVAYFVRETLAACAEFAIAINKEIRFAPDFAPDCQYFMRSPSIPSLLGLEKILKENPWAEFTML